MNTYLANSVTLAFLLASQGTEHLAFGQDRMGPDCGITFAVDSAAVDMTSLESCLAKVDTQSLQHVVIVGTASPDGTMMYNHTLSRKRAENIKQALSERINRQVSMDILGAGEDPVLGRRATIFMTLAETTPAQNQGQGSQGDPSQQKTASTGEAGEMSPRTSPDANVGRQAPLNTLSEAWRVALRTGTDNYRREDHAYTVAGIESSWHRNRSLLDMFRSEVGGGVSVLPSDVYPTAVALHGFLGPGYQLDRFFIPGLVVAGRALAGGVWDRQNKWAIDAGLEGRVGYENPGFSVFGAVGRTKELTRLGIDVGVFF